MQTIVKYQITIDTNISIFPPGKFVLQGSCSKTYLSGPKDCMVCFASFCVYESK